MNQQITEEDLKNMTPEQIAVLQKQNCIFCHIVAGKVSSKKVYDDEHCIGILDINPANPGHVLLLPKEHYAVMPQIPENIIGHMFMVAKGISHAVLRAFKAEGTNIFVANGIPAGQRAQHFMMHIIPRKSSDGLDMFKIPHHSLDPEQAKQVFAVLKKRINAVFNITNQPLVLPEDREPEQIEPTEEKTQKGKMQPGKPQQERAQQERAQQEKAQSQTNHRMQKEKRGKTEFKEGQREGQKEQQQKKQQEQQKQQDGQQGHESETEREDSDEHADSDKDDSKTKYSHEENDEDDKEGNHHDNDDGTDDEDDDKSRKGIDLDKIAQMFGG